MEDLHGRIQKLKMSSLNDFLARANEEAAESKSSLRPDIEKVFDVVKRKARDARQIANNEERAVAFENDRVRTKNECNRKKSTELRKKHKEDLAEIDFTRNDLESAESMDSPHRVPGARNDFADIEKRLAQAFDVYATKETLRNELLRICCQAGAAIIDYPPTSEDFRIMLVDYSQIHPIRISKKSSPEELIKKTAEACETLLEMKRKTACIRKINNENSFSSPSESSKDGTNYSIQTSALNSSENRTQKPGLIDITGYSTFDSSMESSG